MLSHYYESEAQGGFGQGLLDDKHLSHKACAQNGLHESPPEWKTQTRYFGAAFRAGPSPRSPPPAPAPPPLHTWLPHTVETPLSSLWVPEESCLRVFIRTTPSSRTLILTFFFLRNYRSSFFPLFPSFLDFPPSLSFPPPSPSSFLSFFSHTKE